MPAAMRWEKEARALFWPWLAVMALAVQHTVWDFHGYTLFGCFVGIPFLAALSFGHEFHHGTTGQLLSQPVSRSQIWREKMIVLAIAASSSAGLYVYLWRTELTPVQVTFGGLYLLTMAASAPYGVLLARSTIGGVVLAWVPLWVTWVGGFVLSTLFPTSVLGSFPLLVQNGFAGAAATRALSFLYPFVLLYAAAVLWLGARTFRQFQVRGERSEDLFSDLPGFLPERLAARLRAHPAQPSLNLLRKEFRLLRPVWMLALLFLLYMACLLALGFGPPDNKANSDPSAPARAIAFILPFVGIVPLSALLAGCLPLGEERKWGTQSWHLTLPIASRRQWIAKVLAGMFTALVCAAILPVLMYFLASHTAGASQPASIIVAALARAMLGVALVFVISFWCACVAPGTVAGALWVLPVSGVFALAQNYGVLAAEYICRGTGSLRDYFVSWLQWDPGFPGLERFDKGPLHWVWASVPVVLFALLQSRKLFRTQPQDSMLWMLRRLLPLAALALVVAFAAKALTMSTWQPFEETKQALEALHAGNAEQQFSAVELFRAAPLSPATERWLRGGHVGVIPHPRTLGYIATIRLASGLDCQMMVQHFQGRTLAWNFSGCGQPGR